jgi:hypothetical protein
MFAVAHLGQRREHAIHHLVGDDPVDPFRNPARRLFCNLVAEIILVAGQIALAIVERLRDQRLGLTLRPDDGKEFRRRGRSRDRRQGLLRKPADGFADARPR